MELSSFAFVALAFVTDLAVTNYAIPVIVSVARLKGMIDVPDNGRKIHFRQVPTLGGIGMFMGIVFAFKIWAGNSPPAFSPFLMASLIVLFAIGIKDDILVTAPVKKLIGQILAGVLIVMGGGVKLYRFDGFLGVNTAPELLAVLITIFAFVVIINAFNLIDGVDGLAGSITLVGSSAFGLIFLLNGHFGEAVLAFSLAGAIVGFLKHNMEPAKIFMGDTGSMTIGFVMAVLAFRLIALNDVSPMISFNTPTVFALSVLALPLFDTLRVFILRMYDGKSPFRADKRHIHHCLLRFGFRHRSICFILGASALLIIVCSWLLSSLEVHLYLGLVMALTAVVIPAAWFVQRMENKRREKRLNELFDMQAVMDELIRPCVEEKKQPEAVSEPVEWN